MKKTITFLLFICVFKLSAQCWQTVSTGFDHTLALKTDGTLWAWGDNGSGELGDNTVVNKNQPVQIGTANNWVKISAGYNFSVALKSDGTIWTWGSNIYGQLGDGTTTSRRFPGQVGTATDWAAISASTGLTRGHVIARKATGALWGWGANMYGQLGDNTTTNRSLPVPIGTATDWQTVVAGGNHTLALKTNGTLWAWGWNGLQQLGDGTSTDRITPIQIGTATNWQSIDASYSHSLAIKTNGTLWSWGFGDNGQLGLGSATTIANVPIQVGTDTNWSMAHCGIDHSVALKTNLTLWSWGKNENGELGLGTASTTDITTPTQVATNADKVLVTAGQSFTQVLNSDGFLYAAGINADGQLGDATNSDRNTLVNIVCTALAADEFATVASVKAYPNPVTDQLNLTSEKEINTVAIYNLLGQQILFQSIQSQQAILDLSGLTPGAYLVKVTSADKAQTLKIVKQ